MTDPSQKRWFLNADDVKALAEGFGACMASDRIMVDGARVGFMYREAPDTDIDSGWRFLAGDEDQTYLDDDTNVGIFDVNTVANVDPSIVAYLMSRVGSAFERLEGETGFSPVDYQPGID
jgi:hypothetical protein